MTSVMQIVNSVMGQSEFRREKVKVVTARSVTTLIEAFDLICQFIWISGLPVVVTRKVAVGMWIIHATTSRNLRLEEPCATWEMC